MSKLLVYGAYGYTGALIAKLAGNLGLSPILAGRNAEKCAAIATELGFQTRAFDLDTPANVRQGLEEISVVLHCAGPFSHTAKPMVDACIETGTHYLDITGEIEVFEACARRSAEACDATVMLMPGTGFDVVPSDCLAAHLKRRLPKATHLDLAFLGLDGGVSRGTATTMAENIHRGSVVRRDGKLVPIPAGSLTRDVDFGRGAKRCMAIPWGDVSTAHYSTSIPNIAVYLPVPDFVRFGARMSGAFGWLLGSKPVQRFLKNRIDARPPGPSDEQRTRGKSILWGEARDDEGTTVASRLTTPDGYTLTAITALGIAQKVLAGDAPPGFQTPSSAYGADLIMEVESVVREDL